MSEWIDAKESKPSRGQVVLIFVQYTEYVGTSKIEHSRIAFGKYAVLNQHDGHEWVELCENKMTEINNTHVKYWIPLPEMPET